jgi:hypothetical protein
MKKFKSRLNVGYDCCHSDQNVLSSSLLRETLKIKVYKAIVFTYSVWE